MYKVIEKSLGPSGSGGFSLLHPDFLATVPRLRDDVARSRSLPLPLRVRRI